MRLLVLFTLCFVSFSSLAERSGSYRVMTSHHWQIPQGDSVEQALALSKQWRDKVLNQNPFLVKTDYLLRHQKDNRYELLAVYYYQDKDAAAKANGLMGQLIEKAWPDEQERKAFFARLQSYLVKDGRVTKRFKVID